MAITFGNESEFLSAGAVTYTSVATLDTDKFVVTYCDAADANHGTAKIGTVSGTIISFGNEAEFLAADGAAYISAAKLDTDKFIVAYRDNADSSHNTAKIGTVSGTTVTFGAETEFGTSGQYISVAALSPTAFVVAYRDDADSYHGTAKIGTVSGTTITFGIEAEFVSTSYANHISAIALDSSKFVVGYRDGSDSNNGTAKIGTVSGTTIAFGAETEFYGAGAAAYVSIANFDASKFVVTYLTGTDDGEARIGTVDGTTITFGTKAEFLGVEAARDIFIVVLSATKFIVTYRDGSDLDHGTANIGTVADTDITFDGGEEFLSTGAANYISAATLDTNKLVVAYQDAADANHGTAKIGSLPVEFTTSGNLFIQGYNIFPASGDLYANGHEPLVTSGDLFIYGHDSTARSGDLFMSAPEPIGASGNLWTHGYVDYAMSGDLYIQGHQVSQESGNLFISGPQQIDTSGDLYIGGYEDSMVSGELFVHGHNNIAASGDLFITGPQSIIDSGNLFVHRHTDISTSGDLFTEGHTDITTSGDLYTDGHEPLITSGNLFLRGHTDTVVSGDLFVHGHDNITTSGNLYILGPQQVTTSSDLFIRGYDNVSISGNLFIKGFTGTSGASIPSLFIYGRSPVAEIPLRIIHHLTRTGDYHPQLIGSFDPGLSSVNIRVWDVVDGVNVQAAIVTSGCYEIGNTGKWGWSTEHLPFASGYHNYHYYFGMTSHTHDTYYGEFFLTVPEDGRWVYP